MDAESKAVPMDSYLIHDGPNKYLYVTSLEIPISLSNKKLSVKSFEIKNESLIASELNSDFSGFHIRNIFQTKPSDSNVYFVDHGLDVTPFPGGAVSKYEMDKKVVSTYNEHDGKFNFSGDAMIFNDVKYEVFVGLNFVNLLRDGVKDTRILETLKEMGEPQGFLSASFFVMNSEVYLFLGISDIYPSDYDESKRYDYVLNLSQENISFRRLERPVPWNWATVYSEIDDSVRHLGKVLKVAYHDPGFNVPRIGFYSINNKFEFHEISLESVEGLGGNWIPKFELAGTTETNLCALAPLRSGSGGGKYGLLKLVLANSGEKKLEDLCLVGIHKIDGWIMGLSCDMKLIKIQKENL